MNTKLISTLTFTLFLLILSIDLNSQDNSSIFKTCEVSDTRANIMSCEEILLLNIIYKEFLPYAQRAIKSDESNELLMTFVIDPTGMVNDFQIKEKSPGISTDLPKGVPLNRPYVPVWISEYIGAKELTVNYKIPQDLKPDFDTKALQFRIYDGLVFKVVEQMPRFPGCEYEASDKEKDDCANIKMKEYLYKNLKYPAEAKEKKIEGQVVLQFVIEEDGTITNINVVRDIGYGCGDAAADVVASMNYMSEMWTQGKQRGRNVRVLYTLPVKFKL